MALWRCTPCTTAYAVGAPRCPACGSTDYQEDGMPSVHRDREPTYEPAPELVESVEAQSVDEQADERPSPRPRNRRDKGPRRPVATAQAGHAAGSGEASGA